MIQASYKNIEDFKKNCHCSLAIYNYIDNISSNTRWFFQQCYMLDNHKQYVVELRSYDTPDYKDYKATLIATYNSNSNAYDIRISNMFEPS